MPVVDFLPKFLWAFVRLLRIKLKAGVTPAQRFDSQVDLNYYN